MRAMITAQPTPQIKLIQKEYAYLVGALSSDGVVAGFTKPAIEGDPGREMHKALSFLDKKFDLAYMKQVHGSDVQKIKEPGVYTCDGIFTDVKGLTLVVRTADCLPLVFYSRKENAAGVVHMGWRSARDGILENIPYDLSSFKVIAGVGMRRCCYEVGSEFLDYTVMKPYIQARNNKYYFDAPAFARKTLMSKGLKEENFLDVDICSYCSDQKFFSHRKTATPNRTLSFILLLNNVTRLSLT